MVTMIYSGSYPKEISLVPSGAKVTIRYLEPGDEHGLLNFFCRIPPEERHYLKEDVTSPKIIGSWVQDIDHDRVLPLVAISDGRIVADATLHRFPIWPQRRLGEIRIVVDPMYRNQGLGTAMLKELSDIAHANGLERLLFDLVEGKQNSAIKLAKRLGFTKEAILYNRVRGADGKFHNIVIMECSLAT